PVHRVAPRVLRRTVYSGDERLPIPAPSAYHGSPHDDRSRTISQLIHPRSWLAAVLADVSPLRADRIYSSCVNSPSRQSSEDRPMSKLTHRLVLPLLALLLAVANTFAEEPNRNVRFGLPSPAKTDSAQREDYLIERPQYVLSYNARMLVLKS